MTAMHTTTLETIDCGVPIKRRAWPLPHEGSIANPDVMYGIKEVLLFSLKKDDISKGAPAFDMFDRTDQRRSAIEALMHLFLRGIERSVQQLHSKSQGNLTYPGFPFEVYLEAVMSRPADQLPVKPDEFEQKQKLAAAQNMLRNYGPERVNVEHLMRGARSSNGNALFGSASIADIPFMKGHDDRDVVEYRIWAFSRETGVSMATCISEMLNNAMQYALIVFGSSDLLPEKCNTQQIMKQQKSGAAFQEPPSIRAIAGDHERHRTLSTPELYIEAVYQYNRDKRLRTAEYLNRCKAPKAKFGNLQNPINPARVFSAKRYFRAACFSQIVEERQQHLANYYNRDKRCWMFPVPENVLVVPSELWSVKKFRRMYTPDHQKLMIEPRLDRGQTEAAAVRQRRARANAAAAAAAESARALAAEVAAAAEGAAAEALNPADLVASDSEPEIDLSDDGGEEASVHAPKRRLPRNREAELVNMQGISAQLEVPEGGFSDTEDGAFAMRDSAARGAKPAAEDDAGDESTSSSDGMEDDDDDADDEDDDDDDDDGGGGDKDDEAEEVDEDEAEEEEGGAGDEEARGGRRRNGAAAAPARANGRPPVPMPPPDYDDDDDNSDDDAGGSGEDGVPRHDMELPRDSNQLINDEFAPLERDNVVMSQNDAILAQNKTHLHTLRSIYLETMMWHISQTRDDAKRAFEYTSMQFRAMEEYISKCMQPYSNISEPGRAINRWMQSAASGPFGLGFCKPTGVFFDEELSLFGSQIVREFTDYEKLLYLHSTHSEIFLLRMAAMTPYWYVFDHLRLHPMLFGENSTSKSYPIRKVRELMIPGTVASFTSQSGQADAHDKDDADIVFVFEEMPRELIAKQSHRKDLLDQLKETLTRGIQSRRRNVPTPDGSFASRVSVSEKHMVYLAATNLKQHEFDEAVASRFVMRHHVRRERTDCTMAEKQMAESNPNKDAYTKKKIERFWHDFRFAQAGHYHIEKLIMIGALLEPSPIVFPLVYKRYKSVLQNRFAITCPMRVDSQVLLFMRKLMIHHAFVWLYHSPLSPHYRAEQFSPWHLLAVNPMLKDTEEMAYFALDFFKESFIDLNQQAVIECLRSYIVPSIFKKDEYRESDQIRQLFTLHRQQNKTPMAGGAGGSYAQGGGGGMQQYHEKKRSFGQFAGADDSQAGAPSIGDLADESDNDPHEQGLGGGGGVVRSSAGPDWNYVPIRTKMIKLAQKISAKMASCEMARRLSTEGVMQVLIALGTSKVLSHKYMRCKAGLYPPVMRDPRSEQMTYPPIRYAESGIVYVHSSIAFGDSGDPHEEAIKACMTSYTPRAAYISGLPQYETQPHILKVRYTQPTNYTPMAPPLPTAYSATGDVPSQYPSPYAAEQAAAAKAKKRAERAAAADDLSSDDDDDDVVTNLDDQNTRPRALLMSYDMYATIYRMRQISMPRSNARTAAFTPQSADNIARKKPSAMRSKLIKYPGDVIKECNAATERAKKYARTISELGDADIRRFRDEAGAEADFALIDADEIIADMDDGATTAEDKELVHVMKRQCRAVKDAECNTLGSAAKRKEAMEKDIANMMELAATAPPKELAPAAAATAVTTQQQTVPAAAAASTADANHQSIVDENAALRVTTGVCTPPNERDYDTYGGVDAQLMEQGAALEADLVASEELNMALDAQTRERLEKFARESHARMQTDDNNYYGDI